jgi:hypothetical protein
MCVLCVAPHGENIMDSHIGDARPNPTKHDQKMSNPAGSTQTGGLLDHRDRLLRAPSTRTGSRSRIHPGVTACSL